MSYELDPIAGQWYRHLDKDQLFRVASIDEDDDLIQIQHFDDDLEELDSETWFTMDLDRAETPEDWIGPVDDVETDDPGDGEAEVTEADWRAPLKAKKKPRENWEEEEEEDDEDEKDDWGDGDSSDEI